MLQPERPLAVDVQRGPGNSCRTTRSICTSQPGRNLSFHPGEAGLRAAPMAARNGSIDGIWSKVGPTSIAARRASSSSCKGRPLAARGGPTTPCRGPPWPRGCRETARDAAGGRRPSRASFPPGPAPANRGGRRRRRPPTRRLSAGRCRGWLSPQPAAPPLSIRTRTVPTRPTPARRFRAVLSKAGPGGGFRWRRCA